MCESLPIAQLVTLIAAGTALSSTVPITENQEPGGVRINFLNIQFNPGQFINLWLCSPDQATCDMQTSMLSDHIQLNNVGGKGQIIFEIGFR